MTAPLLQVAVDQIRALYSPETRAMMDQAARDLIDGGIVHKPRHHAEALAHIMMGAELGMAPAQALRSIWLKDGAPILHGDALLAVMRAVPGARVDLVVTTPEVCIVEAERPGHFPFRMTFRLRESMRQELHAKGSQYPWATTRARCISAVARVVFPDVATRLMVPEEMDVTDRFFEIHGEAVRPPGAPEETLRVKSREELLDRLRGMAPLVWPETILVKIVDAADAAWKEHRRHQERGEPVQDGPARGPVCGKADPDGQAPPCDSIQNHRGPCAWAPDGPGLAPPPRPPETPRQQAVRERSEPFTDQEKAVMDRLSAPWASLDLVEELEACLRGQMEEIQGLRPPVRLALESRYTARNDTLRLGELRRRRQTAGPDASQDGPGGHEPEEQPQ